MIVQFFNPEKNEAKNEANTAIFKDETTPPKKVFSVLSKACFDCHSNKTEYPLYAEIFPISLWIDHHINDGKKHLNFSEWENYSLKKKIHKLEELIEEIKGKDMPLKSYAFIHSAAKLDSNQVNEVLNWANQIKRKYVFELNN